MYRRFLHFCPILSQCPSVRSVSSLQNLEQAVRAEVEAKNYDKIPDLLVSLDSSQIPQTHVLLSSAWLDQRCLSQSVANILLEMQSIGYHPDCGTCNYLLSSLCAVDQLVEAVKVLKGMGGAGCIPDSNSYGIVIGAMCRVRRTAEAEDLIKQMVVKYGLTPGQGTLVKLLAALRANREIWKSVEMIEFLEKEGNSVGFESYELVIEGCLEKREYVLAGKVAMGMTERGFIPYIKVRQKIIEGLTSIDEWKIACAVRQRFAALKS
ncbi:Tetratricopeptide-like helical domain superfamily [Sesbania bispinosa]|nr:Tetratricopeptide-like helical domain superfamily [Sesbania bispinosa]